MSRLPLEICLLVIEAVGLGRASGAWDDEYSGDCIETLKACSLVCNAWYHHTVPYLWSSITLDIQPPAPQITSNEESCLLIRREWCTETRQEATLPLVDVLGVFQSNLRLMDSIRHVNLRFSAIIQRSELISTPELVAFCKTLAPLPRFSWEVEQFEDNYIFIQSYNCTDDEDNLLVQMVVPFCHSPILTTFSFSGVTFPLDILKAMPNVKDISFTDVWDCVNPYSLANQRFTLQLFPFLRRARFCGAEPLYRELIEFKDSFSQLEELQVSGSAYSKYAQDDELPKLLSLPQGTLKTVDLYINNTRTFAWSFAKRGMSLDLFTNVESCSIEIADLEPLMKWRSKVQILNILEAAPAGLLFDKLKSFKIHLSSVYFHRFDKIFDPEHRAWRIAKHLLGPGTAPSLKSLTITVSWTEQYEWADDDTHNGAGNEEIISKISSQCLEMLERCSPRWEDDARNVERLFHLGPPFYCPP